MKHNLGNSAKYSLLLGMLAFMVWIYIDANTGEYNTMIKVMKSLPHGDKMGHFILYGGLTLILNLTLGLRQVRIGYHDFLLGSVIILIITFIDEFTQIPQESRTFELLDMSSNLLGIIFFSHLAWVVDRQSWFANFKPDIQK